MVDEIAKSLVLLGCLLLGGYGLLLLYVKLGHNSQKQKPTVSRRFRFRHFH